MVLPDESSVRTLNPKENILKELDGLLTAVTAQSDSREYDCVSRVFGPKIGIKEDPVTGSSHCMIVPYWNDRLHKDSLVCFQASERTGILYCIRNGDRISIAGKAVLYSEGEILKNHQF
ncbi:PhzF family phenazine biosynthesis protein [Ruminobacter sp. RM87]|uniref:PhzF family phenazine biosynthesis protein n=1 Tax=Ruminobacter sp. RM87 TaxID=1200567 RepID=UPI001E296A40|nr:PhzF family phenazine biosynthesis protein [Ruminobacter sp. RM87]